MFSKQTITGTPQIGCKMLTVLGAKILSSVNLCRCPPPLQAFSTQAIFLEMMTLRTFCPLQICLLILKCLQLQGTLTSTPDQNCTTPATQQQGQTPHPSVNIIATTMCNPMKQLLECPTAHCQDLFNFRQTLLMDSDVMLHCPIILNFPLNCLSRLLYLSEVYSHVNASFSLCTIMFNEAQLCAPLK